ncbi:Uncharacterised protein [Nocardia otitidiscaviarum]|uniref:Uncharacterized protein n=1 Tax=Nocardia otitidiscaviarum TaxID=1823 RepID=A0A378Y8D9_9NOCA|nr:Uncharacterised protein [Nocardia otitidiscaviarum]
MNGRATIGDRVDRVEIGRVIGTRPVWIGSTRKGIRRPGRSVPPLGRVPTDPVDSRVA